MVNKLHFFRLKDKKIEYICNAGGHTSKKNITNDYFKVTCLECKEILIKERVKTEVNKQKQKTFDWLNWLMDDGNCSNKAKIPKWVKECVRDYVKELNEGFVLSEDSAQ